MKPANSALRGVRLSDEEFKELNSAHFSLRIAIIFLIVAIIIFALMEFIKLLFQIMKVHTEADKVLSVS